MQPCIQYTLWTLTAIKVWSTTTFERLYSIHSHHDVGDIFTIVYSSDLETIYCGAQNTSIQVYGPLFPCLESQDTIEITINPSGENSVKTYDLLQTPRLTHQVEPTSSSTQRDQGQPNVLQPGTQIKRMTIA